MFTGIVETTGVIIASRIVPGGRRLAIRPAAWGGECLLGASVCVSGVCLTVAESSLPNLEFDVIRETLQRTTLGRKRVGELVNVERSLRVGDRVDGHFVQGHIEGKATVESVIATDHEYVIRLRPEPQLRPYLIPKGSVAVDGVSLTLADVDEHTFSVALIPTTLDRTTLGSLREGDGVNIETDLLARAVVHQLNLLGHREGLTLDILREAGFA